MIVQYVLINDGHLYSCTKNESVPAPLSFLSIVKKKRNWSAAVRVLLLLSFCYILLQSF